MADLFNTLGRLGGFPQPMGSLYGMPNAMGSQSPVVNAMLAWPPLAVMNCKRTGDLDCPCGGWLNHYRRRQSALSSVHCAVEGCHEVATVGGHVKIGAFADRMHIVPLCTSCNQRDGVLLIRAAVRPVPAEPGPGCG